MSRGLICIPVSAPTNREAARLLKLAAGEPADLHEIRFDALEEPPDVAGLLAASARPVIATCRSRRQGGGFRGGSGERLAVLQAACDAGAAYVDAEADVIGGLRRRPGCVVVASWHDFSGVPADLPARVAELAELPGDWVKFAVMPGCPEDNLAALDAIAACPKPVIGIAMGEFGLPLRVLGPAHGSRVAFGSLSRGRESAPGQPTARELSELYRAGSLSRASAVYGLLGDPTAQSPGYLCHNLAFAAAGLDAVYLPFRCRDPGGFLARLAPRLNLRGLSVTIPHKLSALALAGGGLSEAARRAGAVNTLSLRDGAWRGDNTDFSAVAGAVGDKAAAVGLELGGAPALVLGSGGAARGAGAALESLGCRVAAAGRNGERTAALAGAMGWERVSWDEAGSGRWRVVANATSVGMAPESGDTPFPAGGWRPGMLAFDAVHKPRRTRFLREAAAAGAWTVDGLEMFIRQARGQFAIWTGGEMPDSCFAPLTE